MATVLSEKMHAPTADKFEDNDVVENYNTPCSVHTPSKTPMLDAKFTQPEAIKCLNAIRVTLAESAEQNGCTKCAIKDITRIVSVYARDVKAAKKNEQWSKAEKKALKAEAKVFMGEIKREMKQAWKS